MTNVDACKALIESQAAKGLRKYGMPLEVAGASLAGLARHGAEEMADALAYFVELERRAATMEEAVEDLHEEIEQLRSILKRLCETPTDDRAAIGAAWADARTILASPLQASAPGGTGQSEEGL